MHFHLPKPLHGWRAFAGEVGIIAVGVLIALGAEQVAEGIHQRNEVSQLRRGIRGELANDRARWDSIHAQSPCALRRLSALDQWARSAPANGRLIDLRGPRIWSLHLSAWDMAKASSALEHLPLSERLAYGDLYDAMLNLQRSILDALTEWQTIASLAATADQGESRQQLRQAIARERYDILYRERVNYAYLSKRFDALGIKADPSGLTAAATGDVVDPQALCKPLEG